MIEIRNLYKSFVVADGSKQDRLFEDLSLSFADGRFVALTGGSGCGKTTLLNMIGGLDEPDAGSILIGDTDITRLGAARRARFLNKTVGFVFQTHYLLPELTSLANVMLPLRIGGKVGKREARERAGMLLENLGLGKLLDNYPTTMSVGECQRVAIARALATSPPLVLADEPTASLDRGFKQAVMNDLVRLKTDFGTTVVLVTHDTQLLGSTQGIDEVIDVSTLSRRSQRQDAVQELLT